MNASPAPKSSRARPDDFAFCDFAFPPLFDLPVPLFAVLFLAMKGSPDCVLGRLTHSAHRGIREWPGESARVGRFAVEPVAELRRSEHYRHGLGMDRADRLIGLA